MKSTQSGSAWQLVAKEPLIPRQGSVMLSSALMHMTQAVFMATGAGGSRDLYQTHDDDLPANLLARARSAIGALP